MGIIAFSGATSHVGAIMRNPTAHPERSVLLDAGWARMDRAIESARLDAIVVVATDHYETFGLEQYPTFCLGVADRFEGWGEFGTVGGVATGAEQIGLDLLAGLVSHGFDLSRAHEMKLDHSFMVPIQRLRTVAALPVVPLFVNCNTPPLPTYRRCLELGAGIRDVVGALADGLRVGVLGTGGISHWVGLPRFGEINEEWDREFLDLLAAGDFDTVSSYRDEVVEQVAGNGALEIRTWLVAAGASGGRAADVLGYARMDDWCIGAGVVQFDAVTAS